MVVAAPRAPSKGIETPATGARLALSATLQPPAPPRRALRPRVILA